MIEVTGRRRRRCVQLLDDFKLKREYWKLKQEALDRAVERTCSGRGYGSVVRQTTLAAYVHSRVQKFPA